MHRDQLVAYLDALLRIKEIADQSDNGLQVEGSDHVEKVVLAVDACRPAILHAHDAGAQMLIVHHGLFWGHLRMAIGVHGRRLRALLNAGISLYAAHLPLDIHPELGNNIQLAHALGLQAELVTVEDHRLPIAVGARLSVPLSRDSFVDIVQQTLRYPASVWPFGPHLVKRVAISTGSASHLAEVIALRGFDTLLTGEPRHSTYHEARELEINMIFGGHYATETWGLHALGRRLKEDLDLEVEFFDMPTGL